MKKPMSPEHKALAQQLSAWFPRYKTVIDAYVHSLLREASRLLQSSPTLDSDSTDATLEHFFEFATKVSALAEEIACATRSLESSEIYLHIIRDNIEPDEQMLAEIASLGAYIYLMDVATKGQDPEAEVTPAIAELSEMWIMSEKFAGHLAQMGEVVREFRSICSVANVSASIDPTGVAFIQGADGTAIAAPSILLEEFWPRVRPEDTSH